MSRTTDELAGVVELFGALTRAELSRALAELAFKHGQAVDESAFDDSIERAVAEYHLVEATGEESLLVVGPAAFPTLPENAPDLPHIMDVPDRDIDRTALGERVRDRLAEEAADAVADGDEARARDLLDVSYDLEAWAPVDADGVRDRLDDCLDDSRAN